MKKNWFGNKGIVIHLTEYKYKVNPLDVIDQHQKASHRNPNGQFYFSCGTHFDDLADVDYLLLYCNNGARGYDFFVAKVTQKSISCQNPLCPEDAAIYSPKEWACIEECTWFMLTDLELFVEENRLTQLVVTSGGREITFLDRIHSNVPLKACYVRGPIII
jgi:hypothetical protein